MSNQIKSNDETQIQMQNRNTDFICPNQFKEVNEASNESEVNGNHTDGSSLQYLPVYCRFEKDNQTLILLYNGTEEKFEIGTCLNKSYTKW